MPKRTEVPRVLLFFPVLCACWLFSCASYVPLTESILRKYEINGDNIKRVQLYFASTPTRHVMQEDLDDRTARLSQVLWNYVERDKTAQLEVGDDKSKGAVLRVQERESQEDVVLRDLTPGVATEMNVEEGLLSVDFGEGIILPFQMHASRANANRAYFFEPCDLTIGARQYSWRAGHGYLRFKASDLYKLEKEYSKKQVKGRKL